MNTEINEFGNIFLHSEGHEVYHTGDKIPVGTRPAPSEVGPFLYFEATGAGVVLSFFASRGKKYAMVVNHSVTCRQEYNVAFNADKFYIRGISDNALESISELTRETKYTPFPGDFEKPEFQLISKYRLEPGFYSIFEYENKS